VVQCPGQECWRHRKQQHARCTVSHRFGACRGHLDGRRRRRPEHPALRSLPCPFLEAPLNRELRAATAPAAPLPLAPPQPPITSAPPPVALARLNSVFDNLAAATPSMLDMPPLTNATDGVQCSGSLELSGAGPMKWLTRRRSRNADAANDTAGAAACAACAACAAPAQHYRGLEGKFLVVHSKQGGRRVAPLAAAVGKVSRGSSARCRRGDEEWGLLDACGHSGSSDSSLRGGSGDIAEYECAGGAPGKRSPQRGRTFSGRLRSLKARAAGRASEDGAGPSTSAPARSESGPARRVRGSGKAASEHAVPASANVGRMLLGRESGIDCAPPDLQTI
jgi:hypothetical protein